MACLPPSEPEPASSPRASPSPLLVLEVSRTPRCGGRWRAWFPRPPRRASARARAWRLLLPWPDEAARRDRLRAETAAPCSLSVLRSLSPSPWRGPCLRNDPRRAVAAPTPSPAISSPRIADEAEDDLDDADDRCWSEPPRRTAMVASWPHLERFGVSPWAESEVGTLRLRMPSEMRTAAPPAPRVADPVASDPPARECCATVDTALPRSSTRTQEPSRLM
mmetsp:Transcript_18778/g.71481  ORF Transcript_18778/g.71481 Transcript_18778/m.71481 type:complete len:221 (-) Transcript_18778:700-1362(-)